jgi:hypothetical protein
LNGNSIEKFELNKSSNAFKNKHLFECYIKLLN